MNDSPDVIDNGSPLPGRFEVSLKDMLYYWIFRWGD